MVLAMMASVWVDSQRGGVDANCHWRIVLDHTRIGHALRRLPRVKFTSNFYDYLGEDCSFRGTSVPRNEPVETSKCRMSPGFETASRLGLRFHPSFA